MVKKRRRTAWKPVANSGENGIMKSINPDDYEVFVSGVEVSIERTDFCKNKGLCEFYG